MSMKILDSINYGYGHLEPMILGLMAMNKNFLLIGKHGLGKSRIAKVLSLGYGQKSYAFYDATKDDLISIAGIPNPQAIKNGNLTFTPHQRTIWDKSTIVVDEITRASRENQNLWLEILEERTCFGIPLSYRCLIATANPESYAAAFKLDEALLDRFYAVLPIPEHQTEISAETIERITRLATSPKPEIEPETLARIFSEIQSAHGKLVQGPEFEKVIAYSTKLIAELFKNLELKDEGQRAYISPRTYARSFPESILAVAAYHVVAGSTAPLEMAAFDCVRFCLGTKHKLNEQLLIQLHDGSKGLLRDGELSMAEQMRFSIGALRSFEERIAYLNDKGNEITKSLKADELEKFLGTMLQGASKQGEKEKLVHLKKALTELGYTGDILRQVDGHLLLTLNSAVSTFIPRLNSVGLKPGGKTNKPWTQSEKFKELVSSGEFSGLQTEDCIKLKSFIIDVYEEDIIPTDEMIVDLFSSIDLA